MAGLYIAPKSVYMLGYEFVKKLAKKHRVLVTLTIEHRNGTTCTQSFDGRSAAATQSPAKEKP